MKGGPQDAPREACAPPEDGILAGGSPDAEGVATEARLDVVVAPSFLTRFISVGPRRPRIPDQLLVSMYVAPQEWVHPSADTVALGPEGA